MFSLAFILPFCICFDLSIFEKDNAEEIGYFLQITDVHIDFNYTEGGDPECPSTSNYNFNLCCRNKYPNQTEFAGEFGYIGHCDIPRITFEESFTFLSEIIGKLPQKPDWLFYLGDNPAHDIKSQTKEANIEHMKYVYQNLQKSGIDEVYGVVGNHDAYPLDQLAFRPEGSWFLDVQSSFFKPYLTDEEFKDAYEYGMYTHVLAPGLRLIALNTQWVSSRNNLIKDNNVTIDWVTSLLEQAKKNNEKVFITGHLVPGFMWYTTNAHVFDDWTNRFRELVIKYQDVIIAQFYGHEHQDRVTLIRDDEGNAINVCYLVSSLTTFEKVNPSIRIFKYDKKTFEIVDSITYYNDIRASNKDRELKTNWFLEYSAKEEYEMADLSPKSWDVVIQSARNNATFYEKVFLPNFFARNNQQKCEATDGCKQQLWCSCNSVQRTLYEKCLKEKF